MKKHVTYQNGLHPTAKLLFIISYLLFIISSEPAAAQKKRAVSAKASTIDNIEQARQALAVYDFEQAESSLDKEITALKRKKKSTALADSLLARAHQGKMKLHATERIVVIDSIVCAKAAVLKAIHISHESGRLDTYASTYHTGRQAPHSALLEPTLYENEFGNKRYLCLPASHQLAVSDKIGDRWSEPTPLTGLTDEEEEDEDAETSTAQNFPFLLSDGITLYYAATGPESLGGFDIFVTRSDGEDGSFLKPENVGFPYNSPANDYLLAIDEFNQLGYFVSDRHQPADSACIYVFIPNETRQLYGDDISERELRDRARLAAIRDTWDFAATEEGTPQQIVKAARQRLTDLRNGTAAGATSTADFVFPIDDARTYTRLSDFRSPIAREKMKQWVRLNKDIATDATMLERLRDNYATAKPAERKQLSTTILQLEATYYPQLEQLSQLAKEIRNAEIGTR